MVDFAKQRLNMVESQVRPSDVTDRRIMQAMSSLPREMFLPKDRQHVAYADTDLQFKLEGGDTTVSLMAPRTLARMVQFLELGEADIVLNVAAGAGYDAAVLARIAQTVVAIDDDPARVAFATENLSAAGIDNAAVLDRPLTKGHDKEGPYDAILVSGMVDRIDDALLDQLKAGGRLVAVVANGRFGAAMQWKRLDDGCDRRWLFDASAPRLEAFARPPEFTF